MALQKAEHPEPPQPEPDPPFQNRDKENAATWLFWGSGSFFRHHTAAQLSTGRAGRVLQAPLLPQGSDRWV